MEAAVADQSAVRPPRWGPLALAAFVGLVVCSNAASAVWARWVNSNPEGLLMLSSRNRYLALTLAAGVPLVCLPMGRDQLDVAARVVHAGAGLRLEPAAAPEEIAAAARSVLADGSYRRAAERIAAAISEETATDLVVAEIEAVLATAPRREAVTA